MQSLIVSACGLTQPGKPDQVIRLLCSSTSKIIPARSLKLPQYKHESCYRALLAAEIFPPGEAATSFVFSKN